MENGAIPFSMLWLSAAEYFTQIALKFRICKGSNMKKYRLGKSPELAELMVRAVTKNPSSFYISVLSSYFILISFLIKFLKQLLEVAMAIFIYLCLVESQERIL